MNFSLERCDLTTYVYHTQLIGVNYVFIVLQMLNNYIIKYLISIHNRGRGVPTSNL